MPGEIFRIDHLPHTPLSRAALKVARPFLERALQIDTLRTAYHHAQQLTTGSFASRALAALDISPELRGAAVTAIPAHGPLVVMANHPHGALDGLALASVLEVVRPDVRLLANSLLQDIPEMQDLCFFVDPFGGPEAAA